MSAGQRGMLEDPITFELFGCDASALDAPLTLECGHTFSRKTVTNVRSACYGPDTLTLQLSHSDICSVLCTYARFNCS